VLWNPVVAFLATFFEVLATITFLRFLYRVACFGTGMSSPKVHPVERAASVAGFKMPDGWDPRPKPWQRARGGMKGATHAHSKPADVYAARPTGAD
jgi:hypothetical protein